MKSLALHGHRTSVAIDPLMRKPEEERYSCLDGFLNSSDVAKVAGVSRKAARRAIDAYCTAHESSRLEPGGATMSLDSSGVPFPATQTRAQMARIVAEKIGLGRFAIKQRIAERAAKSPPAKPKGKRMSSQQHPWRIEKHGRSTRTMPGGSVEATLTCSKCPVHETVTFRQLCASDEMDRKFSQKGWGVDPAKCPEHNRRNHTPRKETAMATSAPPAATFPHPTPAAIAAQAKMFGLLQTHFDPDTGVYGSGYSDQKVADECHLSVELVAGVRKQAFGELKVPTEVAQLTADIDALESLFNESIAPIQAELAALKRRVNECCRKFGG